MLISHRYKLILLKTEKSSGSSVLTLFREILKENDVLYPANQKVRNFILHQHGTLNKISFDSSVNKFSFGIVKWSLKMAKPGRLKKVAPK